MPWSAYIAGPVAAGFVFGVWTAAVEPRLFRVRRFALPAERVGLPPMRILEISDTHFWGHDARALSFLRGLARREEFDLVALTGDLIHTPAGIPSLTEAAGLWQPSIGSFAVLGGHDYQWTGPVATYWHICTGMRWRGARRPNPVDDVVQALTSRGVTVLEDASAHLTGPCGRHFSLVGLRDAYEFAPDYSAAWRQVPPGTPVLVMAHSPDVVHEAARRGARLGLFGHTHGGQVRLPFIGPVFTRTGLPRRLARGLAWVGETAVVVSAGLGATPWAPYRFLCRPEVLVLELTTTRNVPGEQKGAIRV
jgi:predicted MPP superfamily phosphohydrolase